MGFEELRPLCHGFARGQHRARGRIGVASWPAASQGPDEGDATVAAVALAQLGGGGDQQRSDLVDRGGPGFHRSAACGQQCPQCDGVLIFGHRDTLAGQSDAGGGVGVKRVGLALAAPGGAIRADHFHHGDPRLLQGCSQSHAIGTSPFHACHEDGALLARPGYRRSVPARAGAEFRIRDRLADRVQSRKVDGVQMCIGADDDGPWCCHDW